MNKLGYIRVAAVVPEVKIADVKYNTESIIRELETLIAQHVDIAVFPELSLTSYTCGDLFYQTTLLNEVHRALSVLKEYSINKSICFIVGAPLKYLNSIYNCAVVIYNGKIIGISPKLHLPNYNEFYEKRWFTPGFHKIIGYEIDGINIPFGADIIYKYKDVKFGIEICEDLWVPIPPSCQLAKQGAEIIFNLSASNEQAGKHQYLVNLICQQSARCRCGYVYASAGVGESSTDLAFSGNGIIAENGVILGQTERFLLNSTAITRDIDIEVLRHDRLKYSSFSESSADEGLNNYLVITVAANTIEDTNPIDKEILRHIPAHPFVDEDETRFKERVDEISSIQAWGLTQRLKAINCKKAIIGISGGLDSTLALLVTVKAFDMLGIDRQNIIGVTMPGFGTTGRTHSNACLLMNELGVTSLEIPISKAVKQHFEDIGHDEHTHDATYENSQARERTQILMDLANKYNGIVIGTGDLSELALGWCTYNGDQMSMYGVNASIPKTLVKHLVSGYARIDKNERVREVLEDIIDTPISPELLPANPDDSIDQKTEDLVGPYELHDFFLHGMLRNSFSPEKIFILAQKAFKNRYDKKVIKHWLKTFYKRFFSQQFKRSCMPDGVKVGSVCLSPRGDWRMPSDACVRLWLEEVEKL